jgi:iron complex outermembrane recepter protein
MNRRTSWVCELILTTGLVAMSGVSGAEQAAAVSSTSNGTTEESPSESKKATLEEVVVTATRREESVEKVPVSINALSEDELSAGALKSVAEIAAVTPGLQFATPNGYSTAFTTISIRGLNTDVGASTVGIYLDDTPLQTRLSPWANQGTAYPFVFDLNRVEVERGPQGTLFGAGSEAGTVRFITNAPSLTDFSGFVHGETASTQGGSPSYELGAAVGGPIVQDEIGCRGSVWDRRDGGYVDRIDPIDGMTVARNVNTDEKLATNLACAFKPTADVLVTPSLYYQRVHVGDGNRFYGQYSDASEGVFVSGPLLPEITTDHFVLPAIKVQAQLPFAELTSTTSYLERNVSETLDSSPTICGSGLVDGSAGCGNPLGTGYPASQQDVAYTPSGLSVRAFTQEIRLASNHPDARLTWVAGIFYDHRNQRDFQITYDQAADPSAPNLVAADIQDNHERFIDDQLAAFGQVDIHITNKLTATLGERIARVTTDVLELSGSGLLNAGAPPVAQSTSSETPSTPRIALSYQVDRNDLLYLSASEGYRVGGGNAAVPAFCDAVVPSTYQSDHVWSYEAGVKNTLLGGRLQVNSSVFHIDWFNIQQYISLACGDAYTTNLGSAVSNGFDLALQAIPIEHLRVNLDVGYVNAYYSTSAYASGAPLVLEGDKIGLPPQVNAPWNLNTSATYEIPLREGGKVHLRAEYQYTSQNPGPFINELANSQNYYPLAGPDPATHLYNGRVGATIHKVDVTLFVDNVFNSHPLLGKYQASPTSDLITYTTFRPRTAGLSVNYEFGQ